MLGCAYIIVIDYGSTRLVHAVGSRISRANRCFPPGSRTAQRRETPMERFKENMAWRVLCGRDGLGRSVLSIIGRRWEGVGQGWSWNCGQKGRSREAQSGYFHHSSR
jgi:hypothetical protein